MTEERDRPKATITLIYNDETGSFQRLEWLWGNPWIVQIAAWLVGLTDESGHAVSLPWQGKPKWYLAQYARDAAARRRRLFWMEAIATPVFHWLARRLTGRRTAVPKRR